MKRLMQYTTTIGLLCIFLVNPLWAKKYQIPEKITVSHSSLPLAKQANLELLEAYHKILENPVSLENRNQILEEIFRLYQWDHRLENYDQFLEKYPNVSQREEALDQILSLYIKSPSSSGYSSYSRHLLFPQDQARLESFSTILKNQFKLYSRTAIRKLSPQEVSLAISADTVSSYQQNGQPVTLEQFYAGQQPQRSQTSFALEVQNRSTQFYIVGIRLGVKSPQEQLEITETEAQRTLRLEREKQERAREMEQELREMRQSQQEILVEIRNTMRNLVQQINPSTKNQTEQIIGSIETIEKKQLSEMLDEKTNRSTTSAIEFSAGISSFDTSTNPNQDSLEWLFDGEPKEETIEELPEEIAERPKPVTDALLYREALYYFLLAPQERWKVNLMLGVETPKETQIYVTDVMTVDQKWVDNLRLILAKEITTAMQAKSIMLSFDRYLLDPKAHPWYPALTKQKGIAVGLLNQAIYRRWSGFIQMKVGVYQDYDPDFENPVNIYISNQSQKTFRIYADLNGNQPFQLEIAPLSQVKQTVTIQGLPKSELKAVLRNIELVSPSF